MKSDVLHGDMFAEAPTTDAATKAPGAWGEGVSTNTPVSRDTRPSCAHDPARPFARAAPKFPGIERWSPQASKAGNLSRGGARNPWSEDPPLGDSSNVRGAAALTLGEKSRAHGDKNDEQRVREHGAHLVLPALHFHPPGGKRSTAKKDAARDDFPRLQDHQVPLRL